MATQNPPRQGKAGKTKTLRREPSIEKNSAATEDNSNIPTEHFKEKRGPEKTEASGAIPTEFTHHLTETEDQNSSPEDTRPGMIKPGRSTGKPRNNTTRIITAHGQSDIMPVTGWLVVIDGPGRGTGCQLITGPNKIGRDAENEVALDFGDETISRKEHARITYDDQSRIFYLQHRDGRNLTRINGEPALSPIKLSSGDNIVIGDSTLRFVPLCCEDFDWNV